MRDFKSGTNSQRVIQLCTLHNELSNGWFHLAVTCGIRAMSEMRVASADEGNISCEMHLAESLATFHYIHIHISQAYPFRIDFWESRATLFLIFRRKREPSGSKCASKLHSCDYESHLALVGEIAAERHRRGLEGHSELAGERNERCPTSNLTAINVTSR